MSSHDSTNTTQLLGELSRGDASAADRLLPLLYEEFRHLAANYLRREPPGNTLQPTALVHEAYLKLVDQHRVDWKGRTHFFAVGRKSCVESSSTTRGHGCVTSEGVAATESN